MDESGGTLIVTRHLRRHDERGIPEHPTRLPKTALRTVFGERGLAKSGPSHIDVTHSAHFLPAGPFRGHVLATEYRGDHRIMILHRETGAILWQTGVLPVPLEAIYWDDAHIMCSDQERGIFKLALEDAAVVWHYDTEPHASRGSFLCSSSLTTF